MFVYLPTHVHVYTCYVPDARIRQRYLGCGYYPLVSLVLYLVFRNRARYVVREKDSSYT